MTLHPSELPLLYLHDGDNTLTSRVCKGKLASYVSVSSTETGAPWGPSKCSTSLIIKELWKLTNILEPDYQKTVNPKACTGPQAKVCKRG